MGVSKEKKEGKRQFKAKAYEGRKIAKADISNLKTNNMEFQDKKKMTKLFHVMDENASGKVSLAEIDKAVMLFYPDFRHAPALSAAYKASDNSKDGLIELKEFIFFMNYLVYYNN